MFSYTSSRFLAFLGVLMIILMCYVPLVFVFLPLIRQSHAIVTVVLFAAVTVGATMVLWTYFYAVFTDPGWNTHAQDLMITELEMNEVREDSKHFKDSLDAKKRKLAQIRSNGHVSSQTEELTVENEINQMYLSHIKRLSYCFVCNSVKPLRCHHCKTCQRCVLRMDHHCPWTGNCVGQDNLKYFIQFLFYAPLTMLTVFPAELAIYFTLRPKLAADAATEAIVVFNGIFAICIGLAIGNLFVYQIRNLRVNLTTVEDNIEGARATKPFDIGLKGNIQQVFGGNNKAYDYVFPTAIDFYQS